MYHQIETILDLNDHVFVNHYLVIGDGVTVSVIVTGITNPVTIRVLLVAVRDAKTVILRNERQ